MKKHLLLSGSVLVFLVASLPLTGWADYSSDGVSAYKAGNYNRSMQLLANALKSNPKDSNAMFYLGMSYARLNRFDEARQAFDLVIQTVSPSDPLAVKSRNNINYITNQQIMQVSSTGKAAQVMTASLSKQSADNYLPHVIPHGKVVHFSLARMPLRVYIADGQGVQGWNNSMKQAVIFAMRTWQTALRSKVSFVQTYNEANADIVVKWRRNFTDNLLGVSPFQMVGNTIVRSDIFLAVYYPDGKNPIPIEELKGIAVHELGHAMGIQGHSPYPDDLMFFAKVRRFSTPSQRDISTMRLLYQLDADVQNNTSMSTVAARKYYDLYMQGVKAQTSNQPGEAMNLYRQALSLNPQMPEAKFNLGALLINEGNKLWRQGNLQSAKRNMEEATHLYTEIVRLPNAPNGARENLEVAQSNLSSLNQMLQR